MMEDNTKFVEIQNDSSHNNDDGDQRMHPQSAESIVDEMIQKACIGDGEGSSDEEYQSAEEDGDDDSYVIKSMNENNDTQRKNNENSDAKERDEENEEENDKEEDKVDEMEGRRKEEESLTEEERMHRQERGQTHKNNGNVAFRNGNYDEAVTEYTDALDICPLSFHKDRAIMFANRAACKMKKEAYEDAIGDSTHAIDLHPQYLKAILRRAELYEKTEKLDEALKDYETVVQLDPGHNMARVTCMRLQEQIKDRNEKMKTEMMGKLKDLGNLVLRPFGLSTNNFKLQQDPDTGSYSMQFQQSPTGNGS